MAMTAQLGLTVWRNDDVCEVALRVRGVDLTNVALAMQVRDHGDASGPALIDLVNVSNDNDEGLRVSNVRSEYGVPVSDLRIRIDKSTRQALPYMGEAGDAAQFQYALLIAGRTRLVGAFIVPAHSYGSDSAPAARPAGWGGRSDVGMPASGATLTIAGDDVVELLIDGADQLGALLVTGAEQVAAAQASAGRAEAAARETEPIVANLPAVQNVAADLSGPNKIGTAADNIAAIIAAPAEADRAEAAAAEIDGFFDTDATLYFQGKEVLSGHADSNGRAGWVLTADGVFYANFAMRVGAVSNGLTMRKAADGYFDFNLGTVAGVLPLGDGSEVDSTGTRFWNGREVSWAAGDIANRPWFVAYRDGDVDIPSLPANLPDACIVNGRPLFTKAVSGKRHLFTHPVGGSGQALQITSLGNNDRPFAADATTVGYSTDRYGGAVFMCQPAVGGYERYLYPTADWDAFGDSLTAGAGSTDGNTYPAQLASLLGRSVNNYGLGGQTSGEIAARANAGTALVTVSGGVIPATGAVEVTLAPIAVGGGTGFIANGTELKGWIGNIYGRLVRTGGNYWFVRQAIGAATAVPANTVFRVEPILGDYLARGMLIWAGQNNNFDAAGLAEIKANIAAIISRGPMFGRYLVLGLYRTATNGSAGKLTLNADLAAMYGDRFIDTQALLFNAYDAATATAQDTTDHNNGYVQTSLTSDGLHLTSRGYGIIATGVYNRITAKGWN